MYIQNVNNQISIILLWVVNILIASKTEADLMKIKAKLNCRFKITDLGNYPGFKVKEERGWIVYLSVTERKESLVTEHVESISSAVAVFSSSS